jgi:DNA helicase-2/ATP-dependent DNA helicase PcrA
LEFDNVWLLQIDDLVVPDIKQFTKQAIEEERRLFYVGMTRAKKFLYISCTKYPSKFIFEMGVDLNSA